MKKDALDKLQSLAAMVRDAELGRLGQLNSKIATLEEEKAWINRPVSSLSPDDPFARSGRDGPWNQWRITRTAEINRRIALLRADQFEIQKTARRSVSRCEALEKFEAKSRR